MVLIVSYFGSSCVQPRNYHINNTIFIKSQVMDDTEGISKLSYIYIYIFQGVYSGNKLCDTIHVLLVALFQWRGISGYQTVPHKDIWRGW